MTTTSRMLRQEPLRMDPVTDKLISQGARFLGLPRKGLVTDAVRVHRNQRHEDLREGMVEALSVTGRAASLDV
ncbi:MULTISPECIES: hypothetical protein [unclassified Streptomyces]|uniref:hypothetical protein n=1 Tax=unclassified Streptomyces TaxID=2593676 RepID=UPI0005AA3D93|nr:hypothetical protein [Streptomyces sp. NBRC 110035]